MRLLFKLEHLLQSPVEGLLNNLLEKKSTILKILIHMFHKAKRFNHQPVQFKINIDANKYKLFTKHRCKSYTKKKQYDVILCIISQLL